MAIRSCCGLMQRKSTFNMNDNVGLDPDLVDPVFDFLGQELEPDLRRFDAELDPTLRMALINGSGFVTPTDDYNFHLIVSHRNGQVLVHTASVYGVIHDARAVSNWWDDSSELSERRRLIGLDSIGMLVEQVGGLGSLGDMGISMKRPPAEYGLVLKVTVLNPLRRLDIDRFISGYRAAREVVLS